MATPAAADPERLPGPIQAQVVRVIDGDTILVRARIWLGQDVETNVRLLGVDTPERHGRCAAERNAAARAAAFSATQLSQGTVSLHDVSADKYSRRVVARIITATGQDLSELLLTHGLAHRYDGGTKRSWCD